MAKRKSARKGAPKLPRLYKLAIVCPECRKKIGLRIVPIHPRQLPLVAKHCPRLGCGWFGMVPPSTTKCPAMTKSGTVCGTTLVNGW